MFAFVCHTPCVVKLHSQMPKIRHSFVSRWWTRKHILSCHLRHLREKASCIQQWHLQSEWRKSADSLIWRTIEEHLEAALWVCEIEETLVITAICRQREWLCECAKSAFINVYSAFCVHWIWEWNLVFNWFIYCHFLESYMLFTLPDFEKQVTGLMLAARRGGSFYEKHLMTSANQLTLRFSCEEEIKLPLPVYSYLTLSPWYWPACGIYVVIRAHAALYLSDKSHFL